MRSLCPLRRILCLAVVTAVSLLGPAPAVRAQAPTGLEGTVEGVLTVIWGDGAPEQPGSVGPLAVVTDDNGHSVRLQLPEELAAALGGLEAVNGRRVRALGTWSATLRADGAPAALEVRFITLVEGAGPDAITALTGSQPWVSILCKFTNISNEPKTLSFFQNMFSSNYPGLDHYWREVSYGNINVVGSSAAGWVTLPYAQTHYMPTPGSGCLDGDPLNDADLNALFADCTAAADSLIDFANGGNPFAGINLMFNGDLDGCAWGGGHWATLDGVTKVWRTTWEPPWGYSNVTVMEHEMGHGFGLPHSCYNPGSVYDNAWDVMSDTWSYTTSHATYGRVGQHTISHHKDTLLGWLRAPEKVTVNGNDSTTTVLERSALPFAPGPKMVKVPIGGSSTHFYTVEARRRAGYDMSTPTDGVVIHEVDTSRSIDAYVQGTDGGYGAVRSPGNLFTDAVNNIGIVVTASVNTAFEVAVANGSAMAASYPGVDANSGAGSSSNVNGVLEPGESILFEPKWTNVSTGLVSPTSSLSGFTGPGGATYSINDGAAGFGSVASTATASCTNTGNCFRLSVSAPASRPLLHWDTTATESLSSGATKTWTLHIGSSFSDVPPGHWAYGFVENLLHSGITAGCGGSLFCPGNTITRWQMAPFLAKALTGGSIPTTGTVEGRGSYNCVGGGTSVFSDVSPGDAACKAIHYIASRRITSGCGGSLYCPGNTVSRWEMAVFLAKSMAGSGVPASGTVPGRGSYNCTAGGTSVFTDVSAGDVGCKFIHFIAAQGVTSGCGGSLYCPWNNVKRDQMAIFMTRAFGLALYSP